MSEGLSVSRRLRARRRTVRLSLALAASGVVVAFVSAGVERVGRGAGAMNGGVPFRPAVLGGQPAGALVLAQEDHELAIALAVAPRGRKTLLVATVLAPNGTGADGLAVHFSVQRAKGSWLTVAGRAGGAGSYEAVIPVTPRGRAARVLVTRSDGQVDSVTFPPPTTWPPRPARGLLERIDRRYRGLGSLVIHERLASDNTHVLWTTYWAQAPDRLTISSSNGDRSIVIGSRRWDKQAGAPWRSSQQQPALQAIAPYWRGVIQDATSLGTVRVDGRAALRLSFAAPQIPAFFELVVDARNYRPLSMNMVAAAHFMRHSYSGFRSALSIEPPTNRPGSTKKIRDRGGPRPIHRVRFDDSLP